MSEQELAVATRDRIGRIYKFHGTYGTTTKTAELSGEVNVEETNTPTTTVSEQTEDEMDATLVFNRFKPASVAGKILRALVAGPKTPAQVAHLAGSRSVDNIMAPGGWFYQLRKFGKTSGKFALSLNDNGRLVLAVNKRYAKQV